MGSNLTNTNLKLIILTLALREENLKSIPNNISSEKIRIQNDIKENKTIYEKIANQLRETEKNSNEINKKLKLEEIKLNELREDRIRTEGLINTINHY